MLLIRVILYY